VTPPCPSSCPEPPLILLLLLFPLPFLPLPPSFGGSELVCAAAPDIAF